jgi:hypothetical protein
MAAFDYDPHSKPEGGMSFDKSYRYVTTASGEVVSLRTLVRRANKARREAKAKAAAQKAKAA